MDENNIIKKKKNNNYYRRHHNHNRNYYKNQKKKNLILDLNDTGEIRNIMSYNQKEEPVVENILLVNEQTQTKTENDLVLNQEPVIENNVDYDEPVVPLRKTKTRNKISINSKYLKYGASFAILLIAIFSTSYSYFNYTKEDQRQADIAAGEVYVRLVENSTTINLDKMYPREDSEARSRNDNYFDFTIKGKNTSLSKAVIYSINIKNGDAVNAKTRIDPQYVKVDLQEKINNNYEYILEGVPLSDFNYSNVVPTNTTSEITKEFRLRIWVGDNIIISDTETGASYTQAQFKNLFATYKISVDSRDAKLGVETVKGAILAKVNAETNSCNPVWVDDMGTANDTSDDITYFSGTNECVDMNYVWYSGKLWRIVAIYPDGSMKLVTQNSITSISFYNANFNSSVAKRWLNEEFYETLYNSNGIVDTAKKWNATQLESVSDRPSETTLVDSNVGLINAYEYYNSIRCIGSDTCTGTTYSTGFLNIGYNLTLLSIYSSTKTWYATSSGVNNGNATSARGIRPAIYVKNNIELTGDGTVSNPYRITGDKPIGQVNEQINNRLSGEYVKLKNGNSEQVFRIVDVEDNKTKIVAMDYAFNGTYYKFREAGINGTWGIGTSPLFTALTESTTGYYDVLVSTYGNLFDTATYYYGLSDGVYLDSVCANRTSGNTKVCDKTTDQGVYNIGLLRYGEMFATQQGPQSTNKDMWLINRYHTNYVWYVGRSSSCAVSNSNNLSMDNVARPTVHLKSTVKILSGSGTESDPYVVGL